jgi:uncharacterized protein YjbI with pentapeptide repeats
VRKIPKWLPSLHEPGPPRLWRIGYALAACFLVALAGLAALWALALLLLHHPTLPRSHVISVHDTVGVAQLVFASVAGAGALVALVVAYRRQRVSEASSAHDRTRVFNERFTTIAAQLGDGQPAVRLAGVHAMAGLADDWAENRQTCVDVLCAYLRLPYDPDPGDDAEPAERSAYRANREVRHTIIRLIGAHLREGAAVSWQGLDLDFTGAVFDGGDFNGARFSAGIVRFGGASFSGDVVSFDRAKFSGGAVNFVNAKFSGGLVSFRLAEFSGDGVRFDIAEFSGGAVNFVNAKFSGGRVTFHGAEFSGGAVDFDRAKFSGGAVGFGLAEFSGGAVRFYVAEFSGGEVSFGGAKFSGGEVSFGGAKFSGGEVDFRDPREWSQPPIFDWKGAPPTGVKLPADVGRQSQ